MATGSYPRASTDPTHEEIAAATAWTNTLEHLPDALAAVEADNPLLAVIELVGHLAGAVRRTNEVQAIIGAQALAEANLHAPPEAL